MLLVAILIIPHTTFAYDEHIERAIKIMQEKYWKAKSLEDLAKEEKASSRKEPIHIDIPSEWKEISIKNKNELAPFKDNLFSYKYFVNEEYDGKYKLISYSQKRDLEERDEIPEKRVSELYRNTANFDTYKKEKTFQYKWKTIGYVENTKAWVDIEWKNIQYLTIYIHWMNWNKWQGVNDYSFWGNFNRIQNLMLENNGSYIATNFSNFGVDWMEEVKQLIKNKKTEYPNAKVFLACGSSGWDICWGIAADNEWNALLNGLLILGSNSGYKWLWNDTLSMKRKGGLIPIFIAHGEKDRVIWLQGQKNFFTAILRKNKDYPVRMHVFTNGTHGTPIRMLDWRVVINWIIKNN